MHSDMLIFDNHVYKRQPERYYLKAVQTVKWWNGSKFEEFDIFEDLQVEYNQDKPYITR